MRHTIMMIAVLRQRTVSVPQAEVSMGRRLAWCLLVCSGAVEVCTGDDKDSKNSADKTQRARTEEYEGPLMGRVAAGSRQDKGRTRK